MSSKTQYLELVSSLVDLEDKLEKVGANVKVKIERPKIMTLGKLKQPAWPLEPYLKEFHFGLVKRKSIKE